MDVVTLLGRGYSRQQIAAIEAARAKKAPAKKAPAKKKVVEDEGPSGPDER